MKKFLNITDQHTKFFGHCILNSQLSLYIGLLQLLVCLWSLSQHIFSLITFHTILYCDFSTNSSLPAMFTSVDAIIFDIGLFHSLWGIHGCVAQHLDGGYGRFGWCITHFASLAFCLPFALFARPKPHFLWPLLVQQSTYGIGLLILSLAALPRVLPTLMGELSKAPILAIFFYLFGTLTNFFLLYIYWHWYWYVEAIWNSAKKLRNNQLQENHNRRTGAIETTTVTPEKNKLSTSTFITSQYSTEILEYWRKQQFDVNSNCKTVKQINFSNKNTPPARSTIEFYSPKTSFLTNSIYCKKKLQPNYLIKTTPTHVFPKTNSTYINVYNNKKNIEKKY